MNIHAGVLEPELSLQESLFACIDNEDWDALSNFFCDDCIYERPGYNPIEGIDELETFYRHERIIKSGKHTVEQSANEDNVVFCEGFFRGVSKDGAQLSERFVDRYILSDAKIEHRQTYFYRAAI